MTLTVDTITLGTLNTERLTELIPYTQTNIAAILTAKYMLFTGSTKMQYFTTLTHHPCFKTIALVAALHGASIKP